jgi:MerR family transcriptional regulator, light-induced transcriptional regulator
MSMQEGKYNIKAVSKLLGIQSGTLRAWERRYHVIAPKRNDSGHRLYTEEHIEILKWLINKVDNGFTISQAVNLLENNEVSFKDQERIITNETDLSMELMDELMRSLLAFDENQANGRLNEAFSLYTIEKVVIDIIGKLLIKIGDQRKSRKVTFAQEHFANSFLRSRLGCILHTMPVGGLLPKVMAVCGPDETSELDLLIFSIYLRRKGFEVLYIGASIPDDEVDLVLEQVKPEFLYLSCTLSENVNKTFELIDKLSSKNQQIQIGLGGNAFRQVSNSIRFPYEKYLVGETKQQWERWIKEKLVH